MGKIKLAIDPGHGMGNSRPGVYDPGAVSGGIDEASIALQWALAGKYIAANAFNGKIDVFLTRSSGTTPSPLSKRVALSSRERCTHYLSIHCNSALLPIASGTEAYYRDLEDKAFASTVLKSACNALRLKNRGLKLEGSSQHSRLAVFGFDGPTTLIELGFITNKSDRSAMSERENRVEFWTSLFKDILR